MIKSKIEVNFHWKRNFGGAAGNKKVEIVIPKDLTYKIGSPKAGLPLLMPYLMQFVKQNEEIDYYTYKILVQDVDTEEKKIAEQKKKELEKQQKEEQKRQQEIEQKKKENERLKKDLENEKQNLYCSRFIVYCLQFRN